jgi:hypothetical protein
MAVGAGGILSVDRLIDALTIVVGGVVVVIKIAARKFSKANPKPETNVAKCGTDFLNGSLVVPFSTMVLAVLLPQIHEYIITTSAVSIALAGGIGVIFVIGELWRLH